MKRVSRFLLCAAACVLFQISTAPVAFAAPFAGLGIDLATFAVLGGSGVTNASGGGALATVINGNVGLSPIGIAACTGFFPCDGGPGIVNGVVQPGNEAAAMLELITALDGGTTFDPLTEAIGLGGLEGRNLAPGVYTVASTTIDFNTLSLTGTGTWTFLMSSSLITGVGATVDISGVGAGSSVFWIVREAATLNADTEFAGFIMAEAGISFRPGATDVCGKALSKTLVSFDGSGTADPFTPNQVGGEGCNLNGGGENGGGENGGNPIPEPGTLVLLGTGIAGLVARRRAARKA